MKVLSLNKELAYLRTTMQHCLLIFIAIKSLASQSKEPVCRIHEKQFSEESSFLILCNQKSPQQNKLAGGFTLDEINTNVIN